MKRLRERQEIAEAINFGKYPVLKIDLADCDEYGLKGSICRVDMGVFSDGSRWYERAELRVYRDEKKITFSSFGCMLSSQYGYTDYMEDVETAMSPIIKPNSEVVIVVHDSNERALYAVYVIETKHVSRHCQTPIFVEPVDMTGFIIRAGALYGKEY